MRWLLSIGVAFVLLFGSGASASIPQSGLWGFVRRGPITPVCIRGRPCSTPAPNLTLVFLRRHAVVGRAVTDGLGKYRLALRPGIYLVKVGASSAGGSVIGRGLTPAGADVLRSRFARVDFTLDTGIR